MLCTIFSYSLIHTIKPLIRKKPISSIVVLEKFSCYSRLSNDIYTAIHIM